MLRIGQGFDMHRFGGNNPLILGGVHIPNHLGLLAHSDGDVVLHAVMDALFGAVGAGDIGEHFPPSDPKLKGIQSARLLQQGWGPFATSYRILNLDITIIAETPKLTHYKTKIKTCLAALLDLDDRQVNIKATTTEGLGALGRAEGIGALAVALLQSLKAVSPSP